MIKRRAISFLALVAIVAGLLGAAQSPMPQPKVTVLWCHVVAGTHATVYFRIDSDVQLHSMTWRMRYGTGWFRYTDTGTPLPPHKPIRRSFVGPPLSSAYSSLPNPENCSLVGAIAMDGRSWYAPTEPLPSFNPTSPPDTATPVPSEIDNPTHDPIGIVGCHMQIGAGGGWAQLWVRFRDLDPARTVDRVIFRGYYDKSGLDFIDGGTFDPHTLITIKGFFGASKLFRKDIGPIPAIVRPGYANLDAADHCAPVSVHFTDGTTWTNPLVGPTEPPPPTPIPSPPKDYQSY